MVHTNHCDLINSEVFPGALLGACPGGRGGDGRRPGLAEPQSRRGGPALRVLAASLWRGAGGRATVRQIEMIQDFTQLGPLDVIRVSLGFPGSGGEFFTEFEELGRDEHRRGQSG